MPKTYRDDSVEASQHSADDADFQESLRLIAMIVREDAELLRRLA
jgi:hypothetical protein